MTPLSSRDVTYHPQSYADTGMRVFWWQGQLYRGIGGQQADLFRQLFQTGVIQRLTDRGLLVESELTPLALENYEVVVRHRTIPFVSYPDEWCAPMFKDGALATLDLAIGLAEHGLTLSDAHPWNVLFDMEKGGPVFVDWGSIVPITGASWAGYDDFCRYALYPLMLMARGHDRLARLCLAGDASGVFESDLTRLLGESAPRKPEGRPLNGRIARFVQKRLRFLPGAWRESLDAPLATRQTAAERRSHLRSLEITRRQVEGIELPPIRTVEAVSQEPGSLPLNQWSAKQRLVQGILAELRPGSTLDIGAGSGWFAKLAAGSGSTVVAFDIDPARVARLYHEARAGRLPIHPLVMDFSRPAPARGLAGGAGLAAWERLRCDLVLALGLLADIAVGPASPMVGRQFVSLDQIAEGLSLFSKHAAVVEFTPFEFPGYTLDLFIAALETRFPNVSIVPLEPDAGVLLVCRK